MVRSNHLSGCIRRTLTTLLLAGSALLAAGCERQADRAPGPETVDAVAPSAPLLEADRAFAAEVAAADPADRGKVWASWFSPSGRQIIPDRVVEGQQAIADLMTPGLATPGYTLTWEPDMGGMSAAGDFGWTSGRYESRQAGPEGDLATFGRYLTIWERQPDATWKAVLDTGVPDRKE